MSQIKRKIKRKRKKRTLSKKEPLDVTVKRGIMKSKKIGRPKEVVTRKHRHAFRLTDEEELLFFKHLQTEGCTVSEFVRTAIKERLS